MNTYNLNKSKHRKVVKTKAKAKAENDWKNSVPDMQPIKGCTGTPAKCTNWKGDAGLKCLCGKEKRKLYS